MSHPIWHEYLRLLSFFASVIGLYILVNSKLDETDDAGVTDYVLLSMSFAYWIVHVLAISAQKWILPDWGTFMLSLKWTAMISYLLTFSCALSLPLHKISVSQRQTE